MDNPRHAHTLCSDCGQPYPPGTIISPDGSILDLAAEAGGPSHEAVCPARVQTASRGLFQANPSTWS